MQEARRDQFAAAVGCVHAIYIIQDTLELNGLVETWKYVKDEQQMRCVFC